MQKFQCCQLCVLGKTRLFLLNEVDSDSLRLSLRYLPKIEEWIQMIAKSTMSCSLDTINVTINCIPARNSVYLLLFLLLFSSLYFQQYTGELAIGLYPFLGPNIVNSISAYFISLIEGKISHLNFHAFFPSYYETGSCLSGLCSVELRRHGWCQLHYHSCRPELGFQCCLWTVSD